MGTKKTSTCLNCGVTKEQENTSGKYCSNKCQSIYQSELKVEKWLSEGNWFVASKQLTPWIRRYILERDKGCSVCGISEWMDKPVTLEIDHVDGDYRNNNEKNLRAICPNCHSQTPTFKNRNNGKGRTLR